MLGHTHALTGAVAWLAVTPITADSVAGIALGTAVAAGAALGPDLDHRSSTATHAWGPVTRGIGFVLGKLCGGHRQGTHTLLAIPAAWLVTYAAVEIAGGWPAVVLIALCAALAFIACEDIVPGRWERTWPYNIAWSAAAGWATVHYQPDLTWLPWAVAVGWAAHIAGDLITRGGVPILKPFSSRRYALTGLRTGGTWETITVWMLTASIAALTAATVMTFPDPWTSAWPRISEAIATHHESTSQPDDATGR